MDITLSAGKVLTPENLADMETTCRQVGAGEVIGHKEQW